MQNQFTNNSSSQWQTRNTMQSSQYQNAQKFQPTGYVTSVYGQNQGQQTSQGFGYGASAYQPLNTYSGYQPQSQQSFHTASYTGNQPGHDAYKRSDSHTPTQSSFSSSSSFGSSYGAGSFANQNQASYAQQPAQSIHSFHLANYRGDEQGHDSYLRSDSQQPAQSQFGGSNYTASHYQPVSASGTSYMSQHQPVGMGGASQYQTGYTGANEPYQSGYTGATTQHQPNYMSMTAQYQPTYTSSASQYQPNYTSATSQIQPTHANQQQTGYGSTISQSTFTDRR